MKALAQNLMEREVLATRVRPIAVMCLCFVSVAPFLLMSVWINKSMMNAICMFSNLNPVLFMENILNLLKATKT